MLNLVVKILLKIINKLKTSKIFISINRCKLLKRNEAYIRIYINYILQEAMKLKERNENQKGKKLLEDLQNLLIKNYRIKRKEYLGDIENAKGFFSEN